MRKFQYCEVSLFTGFLVGVFVSLIILTLGYFTWLLIA